MNPMLQNKISDIVGKKFARASKLHGVGDNLYFFGAFEDEDVRWQCRIIKMMFELNEDGLLDIETSEKELDELESALSEYRDTLIRFVSNEELFTLSNRARAAANVNDA